MPIALPAWLALPPALLGPLPELSSRLDFSALYQQRGRLMQMATALPHLALLPERAVMRDAVSQPFELVLDVVSTSAHFEIKEVIGEQMSLRLLQPDGTYRPWHGYVVEAAQLGADGGLARYRLVMRPWLHFLAHAQRAADLALQALELDFKRYDVHKFADPVVGSAESLRNDWCFGFLSQGRRDVEWTIN